MKRQKRRLADMSTSPAEHPAKRAGTRRKSKSKAAQMDHGTNPRGTRHRRDMERKQPRARRKKGNRDA